MSERGHERARPARLEAARVRPVRDRTGCARSCRRLDALARSPRRALPHTPAVTPSGRGARELYWLEGYGGGVFLPFGDRTSGRGTYGGGRYLLDTVKGSYLGGDDRTLVLDFNFAYNPSCSYDPRWACPLTPSANLRRPTTSSIGSRTATIPIGRRGMRTGCSTCQSSPTSWAADPCGATWC